MNRTSLIPTDETHWLDLRRPNINSTEMSALFDLSPYMTPFEVYHAKKNGLEIPFKSNDRVEKGKRIEGFAAQEIAHKHGWTVTDKPEYTWIPELRIGSSYDFNADCPKRGEGLLEIKAVDYFQHKEKWSADEIPPHIEIQARHQMMVDNKSWIAVAAFTSIYDHYLYFFERDMQFESGMLATAAKFWKDVDEGNEPQPNFYRDSEVIAALYKDASGDLVDMTDSDALEAATSRYILNRDLQTYHEKEKDAAKTEIFRLLQTNGGAWTGNYRIKAAWTKGSPGTLITPNMVGTFIGGKKGHRRCDITRVNTNTN